MTLPSMIHSSIELYKTVIHVIILISFCDGVFCSGGHWFEVLASSFCPLMDEDKRLVQTPLGWF